MAIKVARPRNLPESRHFSPATASWGHRAGECDGRAAWSTERRSSGRIGLSLDPRKRQETIFVPDVSWAVLCCLLTASAVLSSIASWKDPYPSRRNGGGGGYNDGDSDGGA
jgi:hypothetical protein